MEFMNRSGQPTAAPAGVPGQHPAPTGRRKSKGRKVISITAILFVLIALLVAAVTVFISTANVKTESDYVKSDKFQAVFLNGGQVYFGKIRDMNNKYLTMDNIYYLRVNEQVQPDTKANTDKQQDISLAKLGCELHGPEDNMVINREQVTFWENLKDDGQVSKAIAEFVKQNPDGQKCTTPAAS